MMTFGRGRAASSVVVAGLLAAFAVPAASQTSSPAGTTPGPNQCGGTFEQMDTCRTNMQFCGQSLTSVIGERNQARTEAERARARACGPDSEPKWRDIVRTLLSKRLDPLKRERGPCDTFSAVVATNATIVLKGRLAEPQLGQMRQKVRSEIREALPGIDLEIDDRDLRVASPECGQPEVEPGFILGAETPVRREQLTPERTRRMPPHTDCARLGGKVDQMQIDVAVRKRMEDGYWVLDGGLAALCKKNSTGSWDVTRINPEDGILIIRELQP